MIEDLKSTALHGWHTAHMSCISVKGFTKDFIGADALLSSLLPGTETSRENSDDTLCKNKYVYPFVSDSLRKVAVGKNTTVLDREGSKIGSVLSCVTDMGITWYNGKIISINSDNIPENVKIKGLSCGFISVNKKIDQKIIQDSSTGEFPLTLKEKKRSIKASVIKDIRPDRTARKKLSNFI